MTEIADELETGPPAMLCPLCRSRKQATLPFAYAFKGRSLQGVRCQECSMVFVSPQPTAVEIEAMYDESYFNSGDSNHGAHGTRAYMEEALESGEERSVAAARLDARLQGGARRGVFLEVGCGPGFFLREMKTLGWTAQGLELSSYAAEFARKELGLEVRQGSIRPESVSPESVDVVFLGDVLEHLPDPVRDLKTIRNWIRPGGRLGIAVPSTLNLWSAQLGFAAYRVLGREKVLRIPPYHLMEFIPTTLRRMLIQAGYEVESVAVSAVPMRKMGLRGSTLENSGKVALQVLAHTTSRLFNRWGDRILAIAVKR